MAIKNYSAAAETLIQLSGGKENFITVENCATRVRIQYKDLSKVDKKAIGEMDGVLSVIEKDGLQVVVGPGVCNKLCAAINEILSVDRAASTAAPDAPDVTEEKKKGDFLKIISDIFVPVLPAMIAGGIVQGLNNVLKSVAEARAAAAGIAATETLTAAQVWLQNYHLLNLSNLMGLIYACVFNFLAIYVGYTAAKRLSVDPVLGALIGCITLSGDLTKFGTSAGKGGLIGVIISILVLKYIYKFIQKIIPNQVAVIFVPTLSVLITAALMITILMPVCGVLSDAIVSGLMWILDKTGVFGGFILAACFPTLISTGLHHGLTAIHMRTICGRIRSSLSTPTTASCWANTNGSARIFRRLMTNWYISRSISMFRASPRADGVNNWQQQWISRQRCWNSLDVPRPRWARWTVGHCSRHWKGNRFGNGHCLVSMAAIRALQMVG